MDRIIILSFLLLSVTVCISAAPWVFLDSGADMVALSSEISESRVVGVIGLPSRDKSEESVSTEEDMSDMKSSEEKEDKYKSKGNQKENKSSSSDSNSSESTERNINNKPDITTIEPKTLESIKDQKKDSSLSSDSTETTEINLNQDIPKDEPKTFNTQGQPTTVTEENGSETATLPNFGAMVESDLKQKDMNILVEPEPSPLPEQNQNSIEEDVDLEPVVTLDQKKQNSEPKKTE